MDSGRWVDGRYQPYEPQAFWAAADAAPQPGDAGEAPLAISGPEGHADVPAAEDGSGQLVAVAADAGTVAVVDDASDAGASRSPDALLRATAAVLLPLAVVAIAAASSALVGEGRTPLGTDGVPVAAGFSDWAPGMDTLTPLPSLQDFMPRGLPTVPVEPVAGDLPAAPAAGQPERVVRREAPAARVAGDARGRPAPAVRNAPRQTITSPAAPPAAQPQPQQPPQQQQPADQGASAEAGTGGDAIGWAVTDTPTAGGTEAGTGEGSTGTGGGTTGDGSTGTGGDTTGDGTTGTGGDTTGDGTTGTGADTTGDGTTTGGDTTGTGDGTTATGTVGSEGGAPPAP